ncbi:MAG: hypothetical protein Q4E52_07240 [Fibrobacter sp.]|nr:hypothetical protein [Fibrobacter sp.]
MKLELFALCDGAFNYNGKLTIVGATDGYNVPDLPCCIDLNFAIKIYVEAHDRINKLLRIKIKDPEGKPLPATVDCKIDLEQNKEDSHISLAVKMQGIPFVKIGSYTVEILLDDDEIGNYKFFVKKAANG